MADSNDNENTSSDEFSNELDAMLNEAESSAEEDELIDDEDAIDRLLMDDSEEESSKEEEIDEFAEDDPIDSVIEEAMSANNIEEEEEDDFNIDELVDSIEPDTTSDNELAEIDDFGNDDTPESIPETEQSAEENIDPDPAPADDSSDDFLIADFDISAEEDEDELVLEDETPEIVNNPIEENNQIENIQASSEPPPSLSPQAITDIAQSKTAIDELNAQISQLWTDNESFKQQITELSSSTSTSQDNSYAKDIDSLQKEHRKIKKSLIEGDNKTPLVTYIALGIAIVALLVGGGLGAIGFGAQSDVSDLTELVATLEEEIEIITVKNPHSDIEKINKKISTLLTANDNLSKQIAETKKSIQSTHLKAVVDDLVEQNDHAQLAIDLLLAKVETLEKRKFVSASTKKFKKAVPKVKWAVNLVSFKQEWYAKRKAAEFEKKGIPTVVMKVNVDGQIWFRLRVIGFKSKYEAAAYAVKVKKTLNLSSVWVTKA